MASLTFSTIRYEISHLTTINLKFPPIYFMFLSFVIFNDFLFNSKQGKNLIKMIKCFKYKNKKKWVNFTFHLFSQSNMTKEITWIHRIMQQIHNFFLSSSPSHPLVHHLYQPTTTVSIPLIIIITLTIMINNIFHYYPITIKMLWLWRWLVISFKPWLFLFKIIIEILNLLCIVLKINSLFLNFKMTKNWIIIIILIGWCDLISNIHSHGKCM